MTNEKIFSITGKEILKDISCIKNDDGKDEGSEVSTVNYRSGLHVFTILFGCGLAMSILTLIPRHNSIYEPIYWFEIIFPAGFGTIFSITSIVIDLSILMERETIISIGSYLKVILACLLSWIVTFCSCYIFWTKMFDYNHPMPFVGPLCNVVSRIAGFITITRFSIPDVFEKQEFKRKFYSFIKYELLWYMVIMVKFLIGSIFNKLKHNVAQCVIAVLVPVAKRCTHLAFSKVIKQMVDPENEKANVLLTVTMNIHYGLWTAIILIGARSTTIVGMVIVEFLVQLNMTYQVVKLHKIVTVLEDEQTRMAKQKAVRKLLLAELTEGLIPLAYAIGFAMAYYGPNGHLLGYKKNEFWNFKDVGDVSMTFTVMFGLFTIDLISLLLNSTIVWTCCKISLLDEFCTVMQKYWYILALKMINNIWVNFFSLDVNLGYDKTLKFDWITRNETITSFNDSEYV